MAKNKQNPEETEAMEAQNAAAEGFVEPKGFVELIQRYPQFDPMVDARDRRNLGAEAPPIHGYLIGMRELPSVLVDPKTGEVKPWNVLVIELIQAAPVKERGARPGEDKKRMAQKGEHIIVTSTIAIENLRQRFGLDAVIAHPDKVAEVLVRLRVASTKAGQSLWEPVSFKVNPTLLQRSAEQKLNPFAEVARAAAIAAGAAPRAALGSGNGATQGVPSVNQPERSPV